MPNHEEARREKLAEMFPEEMTREQRIKLMRVARGLPTIEHEADAGLEVETPKKREYVIRFGPGGSVQTLYNDDAPIKDILGGAISCPRASDVKFNELTQAWDVHLMDGSEKVFEGFPTKGKAVEFEVNYLNGILAAADR